jgi:hypothetical protein
MKRVTGIGGIFFQARDPVALRAWYQRHLGLDVLEWGGAVFTWSGLRSLLFSSLGSLNRFLSVLMSPSCDGCWNLNISLWRGMGHHLGRRAWCESRIGLGQGLAQDSE